MDGDRRPMTRGEVEQVMATLLERDVQMLCAFSAGLEENYNHRGQFAALFPDLAAAPETTVEFFPHADHTFSDRDQQRALIRLVREWMSTRFAPASAVSAR
jgi:hypothetical protein